MHTDLHHRAFRPISDYGFLSDCRSCALAATDGSIDWLCWPRFDSPSVFGRILDRERGGYWQVSPVGEYTSERRYLPDTNILETTFTTSTGTVRLTSWLHKASRQSLCRLIEGICGEVEMHLDCDPRPGYGQHGPVAWHQRVDYLIAEVEGLGSLVLDGQDAASESRLIRAGQVRELSLTLNRPGPSDMTDSLRRTTRFWTDWCEDLKLPRVYSEEVKRSALVLKGLQYEPSGAIIAAGTTSLPETIRGSRNYDYRFSWLRDSTFTLYALRSVGKLSEATSWLDWLKGIMLQSNSPQLQIMYGVNGEAELAETELGHLEGYEQSAPVRVGNAAAGQRQLDVYGEMLDSIWLQRCSTRRPLNRHRWLMVRELADRAVAEWRQPDEGIWEVRGEPKHFVYSKVMCWVALDRALRMAERDPQVCKDAPLELWRSERAAIREQVMTHGYDETLGAFTQSFGSGTLDASNLLLAQVGFINPHDPRFVATVRAVQRDLTRGGLVDRYRHEETDDGFAGQEGTFGICSFWLVLALRAIGAADEARELFERMLGYSSDLGLMSEELTPEGRHLGNYPQAFSAIALIVCAFALDKQTAEEAAARCRDCSPQPVAA